MAISRPPKPIPLVVIPEQIPDALKRLDQWLIWKYFPKDGEWTKPPLDANRHGNAAKSTDPKTWATFEQAFSTYQRGNFDGMGCTLIDPNGIVGFDLDHCRHPETSEIDAWAVKIVEQVQTYWEISPSGTGLRGFGYGRKPGGRCRVGAFEMYTHGRYLCITGQHLDGTPETLTPVQAAIDAIYAEMFPQHAPQVLSHGTSPAAEDTAIIEELRRYTNGAKFCRLFDDGDLSEYGGDHSAADQALCLLIAFRTQDPDQLDRIFRLSALNRPKWESRPDYRDRTIARAMTSVSDRYQGVSAERNGHAPVADGDAGDDPPEAPLPDPEEWKAELSTTKGGEVRETLGNITLALRHIKPWAKDCWYDVVRDLRMVDKAPLDDLLVTQASLAIEDETHIPMRSKYLVPTALTYLCHEHPRDLLREWIEQLPPWDEQKRLETWLPTYAHAKNDAYGRDVSRLVIVSLVARALNPGCQYRYVVMLEGPENAGKTKLVRSLATPEWYRELSHGLDGKEAHMRIKRAWVAELAELSSFSKTEEARLKSFFTLNEDAYIPKFSNFEVVHKRRAIFIGTHNPEGANEYLRGQTRNTRYLPISVHKINLEGFEAVRIQLFAEAVQYYRAHPLDWWQLSSAGEALADEEREERRQRSVYEDDLDFWLADTKRTVTWVEEILTDHLNVPKDRWNRNIQMEVTKALKALGWVKEKRARLYVGGESKRVVPWRPGDDWRLQP